MQITSLFGASSEAYILIKDDQVKGENCES